MENARDMLVNGCNIVYGDTQEERTAFVTRFLAENREYAFEMHPELKSPKKRLFSDPNVLKVLTSDRLLKGKKSSEEIVRLLKAFDADDYADLPPRALNWAQRTRISIAFDILAYDKTTLLLSEDDGYHEKVLKHFASVMKSYAEGNPLKFVWVIDAVHLDAEALSLCAGLFELKDGMLIQHEVKTESAVISAGAERFSASPNIVKPAAQPRLLLTDHMPVPGTVCRLCDGTEVFVLKKLFGGYVKASTVFHFLTRELETGEVSALQIIKKPKENTFVYLSTFFTSYSRSGATAHPWLHDNVYHEQDMGKNIAYAAYEARLRYCSYLGDHLCKDLLSGETYRPEIRQPIRKELERVKKGDIVSVFLYRGTAYFASSYQTEATVSLFAPDESGKAKHYDVFDRYAPTDVERVYAEKNGVFVQTPCEAWKRYVLHRVKMPSYRHSLPITENENLNAPFASFAWVTPAMGQAVHGLLKGSVDQKKRKSLTFVPFNETDEYAVNVKTVSGECFQRLCEAPVQIWAETFDVGHKLAIPSELPFEKQVLSCLYQEGDRMMCMDKDTYDMMGIPCADLPAVITEGCDFEYYPEIKYCYIRSKGNGKA